MLKPLLLLLVSFTLVNVYCSEESNYEQICFESATRAQNAMNKLEFIKHSADKISRNGNCIDLYISKQRIDLYNKYLKINFNKSITENFAPDKKKCSLELIKIENNILNKDHIKVESHTRIYGITNKNLNQTISTILIQNNHSGVLKIDETLLDIQCKVLNNGYQLKITTKDPKLTISNSIFLLKGQTLSLGNIQKSLIEQKSKLGFPNIINYTKQIQKNSYQYQLKAKF